MKSTLTSGVLFGAIVTAGIAGVAHVSMAQDDEAASFAPLADCENSLPENRQYTMSIRLDIDTRSGQESTLSATLLDPALPDSVEIPEGTETFLRCVLVKLGVPGDAI
ncbi:MAG: hypothetical protein ACWGPN_12535 [Gammaproteobacteria bacterium]